MGTRPLTAHRAHYRVLRKIGLPKDIGRTGDVPGTGVHAQEPTSILHQAALLPSVDTLLTCCREGPPSEYPDHSRHLARADAQRLYSVGGDDDGGTGPWAGRSR